MMKSLSILFLLSFLALAASFAAPALALDENECTSIKGQVMGTVCVPTQETTGLSITPIPQILVAVANWIVYLFGAIAIIALMICGFQYFMSAGDDAQAQNAKRCIRLAITGMIVSAGAFVIIRFIAAIMTDTQPGGIFG